MEAPSAFDRSGDQPCVTKTSLCYDFPFTDVKHLLPNSERAEIPCDLDASQRNEMPMQKTSPMWDCGKIVHAWVREHHTAAIHARRWERPTHARWQQAECLRGKAMA